MINARLERRLRYPARIKEGNKLMRVCARSEPRGDSNGLGAWVIALLCVLTAWGACAPSPRGVHRAQVCPVGTFYDGDGMVAASLPASVEQAVAQARTLALTAAGNNEFLHGADRPWQAHVSVIYGVTEQRAAPALSALQNFVAHERGTWMRFGALAYWDDPRQGRTALVLTVIDPHAVLTALHEALAQRAGIISRFDYHPHVTLAYLGLGTRLADDAEAAIAALVAPQHWLSAGFYLTDACGQTLATATLQPPSSTAVD
jgi:2'-5' RNA ligase